MSFILSTKLNLLKNISLLSPHINPDAVRDLFAPIGYDRTSVQRFLGICKMLTKDIYYEALKRNKGKAQKIFFAAGLPATGKTSHLKMMTEHELVYDGTINSEEKFVEYVQAALSAGQLKFLCTVPIPKGRSSAI